MRSLYADALRHRPPSIRAVLIALVLTGGTVLWVWTIAPSRIEREVRRVLRDCVTDVNAAPLRGGAARLAHCVTPDVVIEFGRGSPPIRGRDTLLGMVGRLERRLAAFLIRVDDTRLEVIDSARVQVTFTVSIIGRGGEVRDDWFDARSFAAEIRRTADGWRMSRLTAAETLR